MCYKFYPDVTMLWPSTEEEICGKIYSASLSDCIDLLSLQNRVNSNKPSWSPVFSVTRSNKQTNLNISIVCSMFDLQNLPDFFNHFAANHCITLNNIGVCYPHFTSSNALPSLLDFVQDYAQLVLIKKSLQLVCVPCSDWRKLTDPLHDC